MTAVSLIFAAMVTTVRPDGPYVENRHAQLGKEFRGLIRHWCSPSARQRRGTATKVMRASASRFRCLADDGRVSHSSHRFHNGARERGNQGNSQRVTSRERI